MLTLAPCSGSPSATLGFVRPEFAFINFEKDESEIVSLRPVADAIMRRKTNCRIHHASVDFS